MSKIQRNAKAYARLLEVEYIFYLSYKGKGRKVILRFAKEDFHHLEGFGQLTDLPLHAMSGDRSFELALAGKIKVTDLQASTKYEKSFIERKVDHLYLLEEFIDNNDIFLII